MKIWPKVSTQICDKSVKINDKSMDGESTKSIEQSITQQVMGDNSMNFEQKAAK